MPSGIGSYKGFTVTAAYSFLVRGKGFSHDVMYFWIGGNSDCVRDEICRHLLNCKKRLAIFPSPAGMSLIKLPLAGNNVIVPGQGEFG